MEAREWRGRLPIGAEVIAGGGVAFRVWAEGHKAVEVDLEGGPGAGRGRGRTSVALTPEGDGYFSGLAPSAGVGTRYRFWIDGDGPYPDPASRWQPEGPHGPSEAIDPGAYRWADHGWRGPELRGLVLYELHVGTLTPEGTWLAAAEALPALAELGINALEVMPVADFPGRFGWGYDGVDLFAPTRLYGPPDDMRRFVDRAHALGIAVLLDVCYSHLGPDGNFLAQFSTAYFSARHKSEWGATFNFDAPGAGPVREFILANAGYWVDEFHLDGLRLDATQMIFDTSPDHILAALVFRVREAAGGRRTLVIGENEAQEARLIRPAGQGGLGLDALWTDDFHHAAMVAATGRREAYYLDYRGTPQEFVSVAKRGFLYQGQWNTRQGKRRGEPTSGLDPARFVIYLQNHDQVANSARGDRFHRLTNPGRYRALTALLLLGPGTPLLFQGQEFAASSPFLYFGDHPPVLAEQMDRGRRDFLTQFRSLALPEMQRRLPSCADPETFLRSKLDPTERVRHAEASALHRDLLRLRRDDPVFRLQRPGGVDGAVLGLEAFALRYLGDGGDDRLLVVNLGVDLHLDPAPEPLLAPPAGSVWELLWSSEDPLYGGGGTPTLEDRHDNWRLPGHAAVALAPHLEEP